MARIAPPPAPPAWTWRAASPLAGLGPGLVGRRHAAAGHRCHVLARSAGGAGHQRAVPRICHPGGLGVAPPRQGGVDPGVGASVDPLGPGRAGVHDGAGHDRPRLVDSPVVAAHQGRRLASADAHRTRRYLRPGRAAPLSGARTGARRRVVLGGGGGSLQGEAKRLRATLVVVWEQDQHDVWLLLTDLAPDDVEGSWYGLRAWIELGFRALKSMGWHWERTRRADPARIARHWLVLAIANLLNVEVGTRLEDAARRGLPPGRLRRLRTPAPSRRRGGTAACLPTAWSGCAFRCCAASAGAPCGCGRRRRQI